MKSTSSKARAAKKSATKKTAAKKTTATKAAVKKTAAKKAVGGYATQWTVAIDPGATVKARVAALADVTRAVCDDETTFDAVLDLLRDASTPAPVRLAALQALQATSFFFAGFAAHRADYLATLRGIATDKNAELRQRVLGILARESDGHTQQLLLDGLKNPAGALVKPEKALQLLSYDPHSEAYTVARKVVGNPPNPTARREALRLLAGDANSVPIFEKVLADKKETAEVRKLSALALNTLAPATLQATARKIVLDDNEDAEMRATCLTALTDVGDDAATAKDETLYKRIDEIKSSSSGALQKGAKRFIAKFGR